MTTVSSCEPYSTLLSCPPFHAKAKRSFGTASSTWQWMAPSHAPAGFVANVKRLPFTSSNPIGVIGSIARSVRPSSALSKVVSGACGKTSSTTMSCVSAFNAASFIMQRLHTRGWRAVLMHFRGASEEPNRLARGYHSGETEDFDFALRLLKTRYPTATFAAVGFSVGGNVLLKWLGEQGARAPVVTAVAVSVPFDLRLSAKAINRGFSRLYQARLLHAMRSNAMAKFSRIEPPFALPKLSELRDFHAYDAAMTAPLHGFAGVDDYYDRCSSRQFLKNVRVPTLILHAIDDPFMSPDVIPTEAELSDQVTLELSQRGGHVGFISAGPKGQPQFWLESRIPQHLESFLST